MDDPKFINLINICAKIPHPGHPLPTIKWWRGDELLSERVQAASKVQQQSVSNVLQFAQLQREHLMMPLTCEVSNTNLTSPVTRTILVDLNRKYCARALSIIPIVFVC